MIDDDWVSVTYNFIIVVGIAMVFVSATFDRPVMLVIFYLITVIAWMRSIHSDKYY